MAQMDSIARQLVPDRPESFSNLATAVFRYPHAFTIPSSVSELATARLANAERAHFAGAFEGVHEQTVASTINEFAEEASAPEFARVSWRQLRRLRMQAFYAHPGFMGRKMIKADARPGDSINPYLSPLQATHLLLFTATQKLINEEYQLTPMEWERQEPVRRKQLEDEFAKDSFGTSNNANRRPVASLVNTSNGVSLKDRLSGSFDTVQTLTFASKTLVEWGV